MLTSSKGEHQSTFDSLLRDPGPRVTSREGEGARHTCQDNGKALSKNTPGMIQ